MLFVLIVVSQGWRQDCPRSVLITPLAILADSERPQIRIIGLRVIACRALAVQEVLHDYLSKAIATAPANARTSSKTTKGIHIGESTHNHDQAMWPLSLSPMNRIVSIPQKPIRIDMVRSFQEGR